MSFTEFQIQLEKKVEALISFLNSMLDSYQRLKAYTLNEKEFLIASNTEKLILNNQTKEATLIEIARLEEERLALVESLRIDLNLQSTPKNELKLLDLAKCLEQQTLSKKALELKKAHAELIKLIDEIQTQNTENAVYAESGIKSLCGAIESIKEIFAGSKVYEKKGLYRHGARQSGNFVRKEI